jgi:transposase
MVGRGELTDAAWAQLEALLPRNGARGGQWKGHRAVINGILWKLRTGAPWRDVPARYGPYQTCADLVLPLAARRHLGPAAGGGADEGGCR